VPHDSRVESDLAKLASGVGIRLQKHIYVRLDEDSDRHFADAEEDLRGSFVLAVENLNGASSIFYWGPPGKANVELRALLLELLNQATYVGPDAAWVDAIIMMQILEREHPKEGVHPAQLVAKQRIAPDGIVAGFGKTEFDMSCLAPQAKQKPGPAMAFENIAEVGAAMAGLLGLLLQALEFSQPTSDLEVGGAFTTVARGMRDGEVVLSIEPLLDKGVNMVDVELPLLEHQVNW
jgi:hypothetical protein